MRILRRRASIAVSCVALCAVACKRESPPPLGPPDPSTRVLALTWNGYCEDTQAESRPADVHRLLLTWEYRLRLTPDRRFTYRWRNVRESPESWREVAGSWAGDRTSWSLQPDLGAESLEPGNPDEGEYPHMSWGPTLALGNVDPHEALRRRPSVGQRGGEAYIIPALDPETGRISSDILTLLPDPRLGLPPNPPAFDMRD